MKNKISLTCLNPEAAVDIPKPEGLKNARVGSLDGKTIGIFWDGKKGGDNFCIAFEELFRERYPTARTIRLVWGDIEAAEKAKKEIDTFIFGVGDSGMGGWFQCSNVIELEKFGKPGVFIVGENAFHTARMSARDSGIPALRIISIPSIDYYPNRATVAGLIPVVNAHFDSILDALKSPLTQEEKNPALLVQEEIRAAIEVDAGSYESALEKFNQVYMENQWGDGLPLVPPTREAVNRMLAGTNRSPAEVIGRIPYRNGAATVEKVAINSVMAGAKPEYLPVIIAAVECLAEENAFSHAMSSEGSFTLMIMVSGPISKEICMNSGIGLLGHGWQANSTIGRAVRLCITNLGHVRPGEIDMALIGRPSSHTFYTFAENIEQSPWESFNEGLGYRPDESCVTVSTVGGAGMGMSIYGGGVVEPWDAGEVIQKMVDEVAGDRSIFAAYKLGVANYFSHFRKHIIIIHPELAIMLHRLGFNTKRSLRNHIYENTMVPYEKLTSEEIKCLEDRINTKPGGMFFVNDAIPEDQLPLFKAALKPGGRVPVVNPEEIHIIVSGSIPGYSFGMSYIRSAHKTKLVRGAALTVAGR